MGGICAAVRCCYLRESVPVLRIYESLRRRRPESTVPVDRSSWGGEMTPCPDSSGLDDLEGVGGARRLFRARSALGKS